VLLVALLASRPARPPRCAGRSTRNLHFSIRAAAARGLVRGAPWLAPAPWQRSRGAGHIQSCRKIGLIHSRLSPPKLVHGDIFEAAGDKQIFVW